jgi:2,4-dienoyl-CoA reductase-like NADH-dependent reductase (Old Yellow Enzyme family)/thioredoxin reductase
MSQTYPHILAPIQVRNTILKNRLLSTNALPHFLMGPENFPGDAVIDYLGRIARNGAAIVTLMDWSDPRQRNMNGDGGHFPSFDLTNYAVENYMNQVADAIHFYHSKASVAVMPLPPKGYGVMDMEHGPFWPNDLPDEPVPPPPPPSGDDGPHGPPPTPPCRQMERPQMEEMIRRVVGVAKKYQSFGFDMITIHMSYQATVLAQFLSPMTNQRTDEYGGSVENRSRFPLELCRAIKEACGSDFLVEVQISGEEAEGGITIADTVEFAKLAEGVIDILQIRAADGDLNHPTGFNSNEIPVTLRVAEAIRASGANILTAPVGGYQDPDQLEQWLAAGKTDLIAAARAFFCDPDYYEKILEGRGEDVVPCIRCNRCHGQGMNGPWLSVCSVNPTFGLERKLDRMITPPKRVKRVAIIGGGPAGMNAAMVAAQRGHQVTLYEARDTLGGQLFHADYPTFKWPIRAFKEYQIRQLNKLGVEIRLNTKATPEQIRAEGYDSVIVALGAVSQPPKIEGLETAQQVWDPLAVYGREQELGHRVVVIGGSDIGTETALYLAQQGHQVTVLTRKGILAPDSQRVHYYDSFRTAWEENENFSYLTHATTIRVNTGKVIYRDRTGEEHTLTCDSVVACGGMKALTQEALAFGGTADQVLFAGDCEKPGNIQKAIKSSYTAAVEV